MISVVTKGTNTIHMNMTRLPHHRHHQKLRAYFEVQTCAEPAPEFAIVLTSDAVVLQTRVLLLFVSESNLRFGFPAWTGLSTRALRYDCHLLHLTKLHLSTRVPVTQ